MTNSDLLADSYERQLLDMLRLTDDLLSRVRAWLDEHPDDAPLDQTLAALGTITEASAQAVTAMRLLGGEPTAIEERRELCPACALRASDDSDGHE